MNTETQLFAELSTSAVWLDLRGVDWCVVYYGGEPHGPYLDMAVDAASTTISAILRDLADDGFAVRLNKHAQVAYANGDWLRVQLHYGPQFRTLARGSMIRRPIFGRAFPVINRSRLNQVRIPIPSSLGTSVLSARCIVQQSPPSSYYS